MRPLLRGLAAAGLLLLGIAVTGAQPLASADSLRARYSSLQQKLAHSPFGRPLYLESVRNGGDVSGDVFAVAEHPFATLNAGLDEASQWCEALILHLNVKQCRSSTGTRTGSLVVHIGTKHAQPPELAQRVEFEFRVLADTEQYLQILLRADKGPLGTHDYRVMLEAIPLDGGRSFFHLAYSYSYGTVARLAMQGYLGTIGRDKVGFTVVGHTPEGQPVYVGDMRGVVERNAMRYYLAIDAYLDSLKLPARERVEYRLREWFAATERYPLQLHELSEREYLEMKRVETARK
ncbi:MAG: hypothetical protein ACM3PU_08670 [Gemmatimonadota bacterium]